MASRTGIDLYGCGACLNNPVGIPAGLLVTFNYTDWSFPAERLYCLLQERGFTRTGGTYEVEGNNVPSFKIAPVPLRDPVIFIQNIQSQINHLP
jgi:hypothetical protein